MFQYNAQEAIELIDYELHRARIDLSVDATWMYIIMKKNIQKKYKPTDILPMDTKTILFDLIREAGQRRPSYTSF